MAIGRGAFACSVYLGDMKATFVGLFMAGTLCALGQDSARVQVLLDAGVGRTFFHAAGDEHPFMDTYRTEGNSYSGGVYLRLIASRLLAVRFGVRAFSRDFGSVTFDYRTPITSQQTGYTPYDQFTRLAFLGVPLAVELRPVPWISLLAGVQALAFLDQTSRPWGDNHAATLYPGTVELMGQVELWPMKWWGLAVRYFHPTEPVRQQSIWSPERLYRRTTHWRTVEIGVMLRLASLRGPRR